MAAARRGLPDMPRSAMAPTLEAPLVDLDSFAPYLMNRVIARGNGALSIALRQHELTFQHWRVLLVLVNRGRRTINTLAEDTGVPQSTLSRLLTRMEKASLVRRLGHREDSRVVEVEVTDTGQRAFAGILPLADQVWTDMVRALAPAEQAQLRQFLQRMLFAGKGVSA